MVLSAATELDQEGHRIPRITGLGVTHAFRACVQTVQVGGESVKVNQSGDLGRTDVMVVSCSGDASFAIGKFFTLW